jgi:hypothetical protein
VCVYNRRGYTRFEYRARDEFAQELLLTLLERPEQFDGMARGQIGGFLASVKGPLDSPQVLAWSFVVGGVAPGSEMSPAKSVKATVVSDRRHRLLGYVERMLPWVRVYLALTGAQHHTLQNWPLSPRAMVAARELGLDLS